MSKIEGWKLVPVVPTEAMLDSAHEVHDAPDEGSEGEYIAEYRRTYRAMLAAAPVPPAQAPVEYASLHDIPTDELAGRVVHSLIMCKGHVNKWDMTITALISGLRAAPVAQPATPASHPLDGLHINKGSMDAAADAYEAEYLAAKSAPTTEAILSLWRDCGHACNDGNAIKFARAAIAIAAPVAQPAAPAWVMDARAVSWAIHRNGGFIDSTCIDKEADEAARLGFRVENQFQPAAPVADLTDTQKAAPELLAALKDLDECYCEAGNDLSKDDRHRHRLALMAARSAIALATGSQS